MAVLVLFELVAELIEVEVSLTESVVAVIIVCSSISSGQLCISLLLVEEMLAQRMQTVMKCITEATCVASMLCAQQTVLQCEEGVRGSCMENSRDAISVGLGRSIEGGRKGRRERVTLQSSVEEREREARVESSTAEKCSLRVHVSTRQ